MTNPHLQRLDTDPAKVVAYQLAYSQFDARLVMGASTMPEDTAIAITGPYNEGKPPYRPIGLCFDGDEGFASVRTVKDKFRKFFSMNEDGSVGAVYEPQVIHRTKIAFQCGPTLVWDGKVDVRTKAEKFQADAVRQSKTKPTMHPFIGIRYVKGVYKLILGISPVFTLQEQAEYLVGLGCHSGIKLDGGSAAMLRVPSENVKIGNQGVVRCALVFRPKGGMIR